MFPDYPLGSSPGFYAEIRIWLIAALVAEWITQLHVDPAVAGSNPAGPEFFFSSVLLLSTEALV